MQYVLVFVESVLFKVIDKALKLTYNISKIILKTSIKKTFQMPSIYCFLL